MADDVDPTFTGKYFDSMDYGHTVTAPLMAFVDAEIKLSRATADFVDQVGFFKDEAGRKQVISAVCDDKKKLGDGTVISDSIEMPFISMVHVPSLIVDTASVVLDLEVSQSAQMKENIDAGGEAEGKVGWGPFSLKVKAKASYSKENTRKTDTRAKQHVEVTLKQAPLPEGLNVLLERLRNNSTTPA